MCAISFSIGCTLVVRALVSGFSSKSNWRLETQTFELQMYFTKQYKYYKIKHLYISHKINTNKSQTNKQKLSVHINQSVCMCVVLCRSHNLFKHSRAPRKQNAARSHLRTTICCCCKTHRCHRANNFDDAIFQQQACV